jgi:hypothetical protein
MGGRSALERTPVFWPLCDQVRKRQDSGKLQVVPFQDLGKENSRST